MLSSISFEKGERIFRERTGRRKERRKAEMTSSQRFPRVNIVGDDYARYGTSIYQKLYNRNSDGTSYVESCVSGGGSSVAGKKQNRDSGSFRVKGVCSTIGGHDDDKLVKTTTIGSSFSVCNGSMVEDVKSMTQQSLETASGSLVMNDGDSLSKRSKIKRRYKSLISSSSKKLINRLHEHGSSDTFSIFSLRTSHSNKPHDLLKSENTIYEKRPVVQYADINGLPVEVVANVLLMISHDQKSLVSTLYVSKIFCEATKIVLYRYPKFTSTYRIGQFITSLRLHPENGAHVKVLDLSALQNGLIGKQASGGYTSSYDDEEANENDDRETKNTAASDSENYPVDEDDTNYEVALAGWRDWRHRNDPFYGATFLNSYNLKKVVSRSSSISSQLSSSTATSQPGNSMTHARKHRSNSSVSSFTSSIMSSFQNASHVSLATTSSTVNGAGGSNSSNGSSNYAAGGKGNSSNGKNIGSDQNAKNRDSIWLKIKIGSKKRTRGKNQRIHEQKKSQQEQKRSNATTTVKFDITQPCKTKHPYTNKFLLKYAPYCDLPVGYILHILKLCPNITRFNLSNLIVCSDFELISKMKKIRPSYSMLPAVQESVITTTKSEADLEVVYLTDSNKSYDYYTNTRNRSSLSDQANFFKSSANSNDYPLPIEGQTKRKNFANHHHQNANNVQLRKLNTVEIFELICREDRPPLEMIKMNGIVWCRQNMIKFLVLKNFIKLKNSLDMKMSFDKAGLNMNLIWTCEGTLKDFVAMIVIDEIHRRDEISLRQIFKDQNDPRFTKDSDIIEISEIFPIEYGLSNDSQRNSEVNFRVTILRSTKPTSYRLRQISSYYHSLVINLCVQDATATDTDAIGSLSNNATPEPCKRLHRMAHDVVNRMCESRTSQLRRTIGENNYIIAASTSTSTSI